MSLFSKIKNIFSINEKTKKVASTTNIYDSSYNALNSSNVPLEIEQMLSLSYITRSIQMIANDVAKTEFSIYKYDAKKEKRELLKNTKLHWMLNRQTNLELNSYDFKKIIVWNLFLYGSAPIYAHYVKNDKGEETLINLIPIYPEVLTQFKGEDGLTYYSIQFDNEMKPVIFNSEEIIY